MAKSNQKVSSSDQLAQDLRDMGANLDDWTDIVAEDDCSEEDGRYFQEIVNIFSRDTEKQVVWGDKFSRQPCSNCSQRQKECLRKGKSAACEECIRKRQKCPRLKRFEAQQAAAFLGISSSISWARYQTWGKAAPRTRKGTTENTDQVESRKRRSSMETPDSPGVPEHPVKKPKTASKAAVVVVSSSVRGPGTLPATSPLKGRKTGKNASQTTDQSAGSLVSTHAARSMAHLAHKKPLSRPVSRPRAEEHTRNSRSLSPSVTDIANEANEIRQQILAFEVALKAAENETASMKQKLNDIEAQLNHTKKLQESHAATFKELESHAREFAAQVSMAETELASTLAEEDKDDTSVTSKIRNATLKFYKNTRGLKLQSS